MNFGRVTKTGRVAIVATALALVAAGCGDATSEVEAETDATRVISLSPAATEMLFAIGAGDQVIAVDEYSNFPENAPTTDLSGFSPNLEAISSYDPDLVVLSSFADAIVPQLNTLHIPTYVAADNPSEITDVYDQIVDLGNLTGRSTEAEDLVERMTDFLDKIAADAPQRSTPLTYYIELDDTYWTYTSASIVSALFERVGLRNIVDDEDLVATQLSAEAIVQANPDVIFLTNSNFGVTPEVVADRPGWSNIAAVEQGHVFELVSDIASRWGPRLVDLLDIVVEKTSQIR
ncbi:ABC transporter substrate-binding protein [Hoyosella rhizosphaerae]|uniref:ABC transporter substrate-binding protein n=1 Tax=Hoyosella rhizosphaerae TaxID=1755582 RepID=A0A916UCP0_9ACTN|nr:ABC transporter substrate-binding protein [Hoyosella rhizosphaerae]MBN4925705.1 ABC transporter substrate-binding protein [Hoyosella rhizosphaerae]GGC68592.1 ABC transporter substrate-binding protein [Hoyosella rhizosphaerae]